jgi:hypothetical protein
MSSGKSSKSLHRAMAGGASPPHRPGRSPSTVEINLAIVARSSSVDLSQSSLLETRFIFVPPLLAGCGSSD